MRLAHRPDAGSATGPAALALALSLALAGGAGAQDCPGPTMDGLFPQDIYVFRGFVTEPAALPSEDGGAWKVEVQVEAAVHLPRSRSRYAITVLATEPDCSARPMTARELRDHYAVGDDVKVVAHVDRTATPATADALVAPHRRVALVLAEAGASGPIRNDFDYYDFLLQLDGRTDDHDKFSILSQMGRYLTSREDFRRLLEDQLDQKRLRRQLLELFDALNEP